MWPGKTFIILVSLRGYLILPIERLHGGLALIKNGYRLLVQLISKAILRQRAVYPPSTTRFWPVTQREASLSR